jgi:hypothetical protein
VFVRVGIALDRLRTDQQQALVLQLAAGGRGSGGDGALA